MRELDWDKRVAKYWDFDYNSFHVYGLEAGMDGKGNDLLEEQWVCIGGGDMDIAAARAWVWELRACNERPAPVWYDQGRWLSGAGEGSEWVSGVRIKDRPVTRARAWISFEARPLQNGCWRIA